MFTLWELFQQQAKIIKKTGTLPTFECKIIALLCQPVAQRSFTKKNN